MPRFNSQLAHWFEGTITSPNLPSLPIVIASETPLYTPYFSIKSHKQFKRCSGATHRIVLPGDHSLLNHCLFGRLAQIQQVHVAGVTLPPDRGNAHVWAFSHRFLVGNASGEEHCLVQSASSITIEVCILTYSCAWELMASGDGGRVPVQCGGAVGVFGIGGQAGKVDVTGFSQLGLCRLGGIHDVLEEAYMAGNKITVCEGNRASEYIIPLYRAGERSPQISPICSTPVDPALLGSQSVQSH